MAGYWNRPDATRAAIDEQGWLHTGDAARIDEEGSMWIIDRLEHAFTSGEHVVYPGDVERCIGEHPAVRDVGVDGSGRAFVVLHDGSKVTENDIIEHGRARLATHSEDTAQRLTRRSLVPRTREWLAPRTRAATQAAARAGLASIRCGPG